MKISTAASTQPNTALAARNLYQQIAADLGTEPSLLIAYSSATHRSAAIVETLADVAPGVPLHGATSCLGAMTGNGFHAAEGVGMALWGIADAKGDYGVGVATIAGDAREAGQRAILDAIAQAGRIGEPPDLVWLSGVPGYEEAVLEGIQQVIGSNIPIAGGSSADNEVAGKWEQYTHNGAHTSAVVVTAMYPSVKTHYAFHSGYSMTETSGVITKADGRTLHEIDGKPAAGVYNEWTNGVIDDYLDGGNVLAATSLHPLGRFVSEVGGSAFHRLAHPETVTPDGAITLFANVEAGEQLVLMEGTQRSLVTRAGRVAQAALNVGHISADDVAGALVVYCAGCMLTVQDSMDDVVTGLRHALKETPFIGTFTFGEQGCFLSGENYHGNLMISVVVFERT